MSRFSAAPALAGALSIGLAAPPALAAAGGAVVLPWGDWIVGFATTAQAVLTPLLVALATGLIARFAPLLGYVLSKSVVEGMVRRVTDYALNAVAGAAKGQVLTVPVGSAVIAAAVQRASDQVPGFVVKAAGGLPGIAEKVFRRLALEDRATAANTLAPALAAAGLAAR
ncbi:hypothetical protein MKK70_01910 [Methylobacterium sp. E-041]|jgi:hypothetical protein|uniref:hypothetical protein n=1 Tax=unclassified Methylobacterium TaxID=2615210 RepID=UPI0011CC2C03|nr:MULTISPECIES: hypothetical protein [unclassified Methylobacterium]MCJ2008371.1 hypothetical protein [Methylobacterium sp. J-092]MCJ2075811.1 hypothetical protein [Methylobacterium sp. E-016]MCJ2104154.1 hypothetical protein [Methylobacterium sp. E-041]TXN34222.1 hypothetical protein FV225_17340 [Methylobacterium sp. WL93]TXN49676.1 hypothetical protein FV227_15300 [Methylobacterium sp. WL119]